MSSVEAGLNRTKKPRQKIRVGLLLVLFAAIVFAGEGIMEVFGLGHPLLAETGGPANYEFLPNQKTHRLWPLDDSGWISRVRTNAYGMRSDAISPVKKPGTLRIYFLGDSITYGTTQVDQEAIFTERVHHELPGIVHKPVEVLNGSASGWAPENELAFLKEHGTLEADRVILVINDGDPTQPPAPVPTGYGIPSPKYNPRFGYEEVWQRLLRPRIDRALKRWHLISAEAPSLSDPGLTVQTDAAVLRQNIGYISQMRDYAAASGAKFSILYIPFATTGKSPALMAKAAPGREAIRQWALKNNVPFVNLGPAIWPYPLSKILLQGGRNAHYNTEGHRLIADLIEQDWSQLSGN